MFALLTPEIHSNEMAHMLQKPVFALPGCQRLSVNTLLCDTLGLAEMITIRDEIWGTSKGRERQLLPSSLGALDATSEVPFPLWQTEERPNTSATKMLHQMSVRAAVVALGLVLRNRFQTN